jgi:hypothetical protein
MSGWLEASKNLKTYVNKIAIGDGQIRQTMYASEWCGGLFP